MKCDFFRFNRLSDRSSGIAALSLTLLLAGCTLQEATPEATPVAATAPMAAEGTPVTPAGPETATTAPAPAGESKTGNPPMSMPGMPDRMAPLTPTPEMDKAIADANQSGDKKKIAEAYAKRAVFRMNDQKAGTKVKYRAALSDTRKALAADPANASAKETKELIESIYTSMSLPIPTDDVP